MRISDWSSDVCSSDLGLAAGVLEETVAAMRTKPGDIVAWLGPAAGPQAYEIGAEVFETFVSRNPRARAAFPATRPGHWHVALSALARPRLADPGVTGVHGARLVTLSAPRRFFSHPLAKQPKRRAG